MYATSSIVGRAIALLDWPIAAHFGPCTPLMRRQFFAHDLAANFRSGVTWAPSDRAAERIHGLSDHVSTVLTVNPV